MSPYEFLKNYKENMPEWLARYSYRDPFSYHDFFGSRIVYYPGSGLDGHPVKLFGSTHSAHCFIYADYLITEKQIDIELHNCFRCFRGYHTFARIHLKEKDLAPNGWKPHVNVRPGAYTMFDVRTDRPYGFIEILERDNDLDEDHGPKRLAILFLGADGFATYDALFCQEEAIHRPFAVVLQDHGFGCNYDCFGRGGLLHRIARQCDVIPEFALVAQNTYPWPEYRKIEELDGDRGGMHNTMRYLYERI